MKRVLSLSRPGPNRAARAGAPPAGARASIQVAITDERVGCVVLVVQNPYGVCGGRVR